MNENNSNNLLNEFLVDNKNFINLVKEFYKYRISMILIAIITIALSFLFNSIFAKTYYKYSQDILVYETGKELEYVNALDILQKYANIFEIDNEIQFDEFYLINAKLRNQFTLEKLFLNLRSWSFIRQSISLIKDNGYKNFNNLSEKEIEEYLSSLINIEYKTIDGIESNLININMICSEEIKSICEVFILKHIENTISTTNIEISNEYKAAVARVLENSKESLKLMELKYNFEFLEKKNELESILTFKENNMRMAEKLGLLDPSEFLQNTISRYEQEAHENYYGYLKGLTWLDAEVTHMQESLENLEDYDLELSQKKLRLQSSISKHQKLLDYLNIKFNKDIELGYQAQRLEAETVQSSNYKIFFIGLSLGIIFSLLYSIIRLFQKAQAK